ncbi:MAG: hypothetical protein EA370_12475 [Wenzhouxiangella sp.]|nr:MAG: hypothetical protein EA370_12475 [Wenzhouxiangella sp.]
MPFLPGFPGVSAPLIEQISTCCFCGICQANCKENKGTTEDTEYTEFSLKRFFGVFGVFGGSRLLGFNVSAFQGSPLFAARQPVW